MSTHTLSSRSLVHSRLLALLGTGACAAVATGAALPPAGTAPVALPPAPSVVHPAAAAPPGAPVVRNAGQSPPAVRFEARGAGGALYFTASEVVIARRSGSV